LDVPPPVFGKGMTYISSARETHTCHNSRTEETFISV
jgi:hypothetical protein